jgi:hypothetical protein
MKLTSYIINVIFILVLQLFVVVNANASRQVFIIVNNANLQPAMYVGVVHEEGQLSGGKVKVKVMITYGPDLPCRSSTDCDNFEQAVTDLLKNHEEKVVVEFLNFTKNGWGPKSVENFLKLKK